MRMALVSKEDIYHIMNLDEWNPGRNRPSGLRSLNEYVNLFSGKSCSENHLDGCHAGQRVWKCRKRFPQQKWVRTRFSTKKCVKAAFARDKKMVRRNRENCGFLSAHIV